jgi:23S rRNA (guanosine2251-2'-O)-methyltransferase
MLIEGKNSIYEALQAGTTFNKLMAAGDVRDEKSQQIVNLAKSRNIRINFVDRKALDKLSPGGRHQGWVGEVTDFIFSEVEDILKLAKSKNEDSFIVILDSIEDPHNLGSIIRVCECAGVHGIIIEKQRAVAVNDTVLKTSAGACAHMKIARVTNINNVIENFKKQNIWVYCADIDGKDIYKSNLTGPIALVIGGESKGIGKLTKQLCDDVITLPVKGKVNSLNASTATSAVVYEALRQRQNKKILKLLADM